MAVNPDNLHGSNGYPTGCTFACHFAAQGTCGQPSSSNPYQGKYPVPPSTTNPGSGGYCQGFIISRLGTTPVSFTSNTNNETPSGNPNGLKVNWTNPQVSSCASAGTTSCIQLRLDAVGYAVNALLTTANSTETNDGITNQFRVGLYPFIQNLCYANVNSTSSCSVGLTTSLTGSTITTFATQLANLLDTGQNTTLGSGGTHFENALNTMNQRPSPAPRGPERPTNPLPYLFIVTDGSQDYQTQSGGNWGSQNWHSNATVPYQNSATVIPPNSVDDDRLLHDDEKSRDNDRCPLHSLSNHPESQMRTLPATKTAMPTIIFQTSPQLFRTARRRIFSTPQTRRRISRAR